MNGEIDIFEGVSFDKAEWYKFKGVGDTIQGTYVDKFHSTDGYGNPQTVYQVQKDGVLYNVAFRDAKFDIHQDMSTAKLGQIVGFKYVEDRKIVNRKKQTVTVKIFRAAHDPRAVDKEWIEKHPNVEFTGERPRFSKDTLNPPVSGAAFVERTLSENDRKAEEDFQSLGSSPASSVIRTAPSSISAEDKLAVITKLAKDKLGVVDETVLKDRVMEATSVAFIPTNYDKIIAALNSIGA